MTLEEKVRMLIVKLECRLCDCEGYWEGPPKNGIVCGEEADLEAEFLRPVIAELRELVEH